MTKTRWCGGQGFVAITYSGGGVRILIRIWYLALATIRYLRMIHDSQPPSSWKTLSSFAIVLKRDATRTPSKRQGQNCVQSCDYRLKVILPMNSLPNAGEMIKRLDYHQVKKGGPI